MASGATKSHIFQQLFSIKILTKLSNKSQFIKLKVIYKTYMASFTPEHPLENFLRKHGLEQHLGTFSQHQVTTLDAAKQLTKEDLLEMNIPIEPGNKILKAFSTGQSSTAGASQGETKTDGSIPVTEPDLTPSNIDMCRDPQHPPTQFTGTEWNTARDAIFKQKSSSELLWECGKHMNMAQRNYGHEITSVGAHGRVFAECACSFLLGGNLEGNLSTSIDSLDENGHGAVKVKKHLHQLRDYGNNAVHYGNKQKMRHKIDIVHSMYIVARYLDDVLSSQGVPKKTKTKKAVSFIY